ncbi:hypothetical protein, partial [Escherichia coli]|uniref:hypothetical protein n=1 Tax=Escherichia coli TaxID=562 RepID=UPI0039E15326
QEDRDQLKQILQAVLAEGGIVPATQPPPAATKVEEASVPWWVKIFGSAIVVILASVLIGIIQNLHATI